MQISHVFLSRELKSFSRRSLEAMMNGVFGVEGVLDGWKKGDLPGKQMVYIVLNDCSRLKSGSVALTPNLSTDDEVNFAVNRLIKDLEAVRKKAKEKIQKSE